MKAKVKDTGEIVDVKFSTHPLTQPLTKLIGGAKINKKVTIRANLISWERILIGEQRRYELAKDAMNGLLSGKTWVNPGFNTTEAAKLAVEFADELIKELKEKIW